MTQLIKKPYPAVTITRKALRMVYSQRPPPIWPHCHRPPLATTPEKCLTSRNFLTVVYSCMK